MICSDPFANGTHNGPRFSEAAIRDAFLQNCTAPADIDLSYVLLSLSVSEVSIGTIFELVHMLNSLGLGMSMVPQDSWFRKVEKLQLVLSDFASWAVKTWNTGEPRQIGLLDVPPKYVSIHRCSSIPIYY